MAITRLGIGAIAAGILACNLMGCADSAPVSEVPTPKPTETPALSPAPTEAVPSDPITPPTVTWIEPLPEAELWARLQQQDVPYFVLMRHALAPGTGDPEGFQLEDCTTQRNLDEVGRLQAQRTGEAFVAQGVTVDRVLSSQWCRCLDTAELMALGTVEPFPPLNSFFSDRSTEPEQTRQVLEFIGSQANQPGVTVMVTHFVNVAAIGGSGVNSGEMVVLALTEPDQVTVLGAIAPL
ncbi:MAG: histidine phosphatase family protein [Cyanobacteria bacterium J06638_28]